MHFIIIKPYNLIASNNNIVKIKPKVIYNISFVNKGLDMINVPRILRDKSFVGNLKLLELIVIGLLIIMFLLLSALIIIAIFVILKRTISLHYIRG